MRSTLSPSLSMLVFALALSPPGAPPVSAEGGDPFAGLELRNVGPLHPSGRVADVEGVPGNPRVLWVGSASGGVWKTTNGGHDFVPVFDDQPIASIGDLALAPSNPEVVYVGSGEGNPRNSVSFGNGVYRTNDGGDSWSHLGLEATRHITRVLVHPTDPDTVWVGALGSVYGPGEERGVFRSTDGGETWTKTLYVDDRHGVADMDIDPENPNVLFAALWRFDRKPWTHSSGSEEGGLFRSVDGGVTWTKLENGLPSFLGRVGVKVAPSNPRTVYAITESHEGTLYRSDDRGETFRQVHDEKRIISRGLYYTDLRVDPVDENRVYAVSSRLFRSIDGGKTFEQISRTTHVDYHSLWIDPEHPERMWQGQDGGVAVSYDRGETWEPFRNLPLGQFYQVFADQRQPFYQLGGGMQDNGAWSGPSRTREPGGILPDDWRIISFGDAYFTVPHPDKVDLFLSESQGGGIVRTDMVTRQQVDVSPQPKRNDGGPVEDLEVRFNWNAPIVQSPHDPHKIYFAGNVVFETRDFGETWTRISPDLTTDDPEKQGKAGAPGWIENTTAEYHCTIISFAESPVEAGVLWAGTDDGNLQLSKDGGATWTDLTAGLGVPEFSPVSHVEPSAVDGAVAYVAFDRHMFDDLRPHIYRTTDYGATWTRMVKGIGEQSWVWVVKEDPQNPDVLYAGTELGLFVSFDAGGSWRDMRFGNFPPVSVHDLFIHPRENDLVIGTHGRAIWVLDDVTALQQWGDVPADRSAFLFDPRPALRFPRKFTRYGLGDKELTLPNPPYGALLTYYLAENLGVDQDGAAEKDATAEDPTADEGASGGEGAAAVKIEILAADGEVLRTLEDLPTTSGIHRVAWNLAMEPPEPRSDEPAEVSPWRPAPRGPEVLPGTYTVRLTAGDAVQEATVDVRLDPTLSTPRGGLVAQQAAALRLRGLRSDVHRVLRALDRAQAQAEERRNTVDALEMDLSEELRERWERVDGELGALKDLLERPDGVPFWSVGPRLSERLESLFNSVDSAYAAPTSAQAAFLDALAAESAEAVANWGRLEKEDLPALSEALVAEGLPGFALGRTEGN